LERGFGGQVRALDQADDDYGEADEAAWIAREDALDGFGRSATKRAPKGGAPRQIVRDARGRFVRKEPK
jgi:hypothetical protein